MRIRPLLMALALLYLVLSPGALALQQAALGEDARLAKAITVQRGGAPLRDVLADIAGGAAGSGERHGAGGGGGVLSF